MRDDVADPVTRLQIRSARPDEFAAVGDLCVAAYAPFVAGDDQYLAVLRDAALRASEAELLIAIDGGVLLGTVTFVPDGGPLGEIAGPGETEFRMLAVDPAAQGRGVARRSSDTSWKPAGAGARRASSVRANARCSPRTASTSVSASGARRSATGHRCREWTSSRSRSRSEEHRDAGGKRSQ